MGTLASIRTAVQGLVNDVGGTSLDASPTLINLAVNQAIFELSFDEFSFNTRSVTKPIVNSVAVSGGTWSGGFATLTVPTGHGYVAGINAIVAGVSPTGWNGTFLLSGVSDTTITYPLATNPGAYVSGGTVNWYDVACIAKPTDFLKLRGIAPVSMFYALGTDANRPLSLVSLPKFNEQRRSFSGNPVIATFLDNSLLISPAIGSTGTITIYYHKKYDTLTLDADNNDFTNNAEMLVINKTTSIVYRIKENNDMSGVYMQAAEGIATLMRAANHSNVSDSIYEVESIL